MLLSKIFKSYHDSVWMWQGAQCLLVDAASLKHYAPDTRHDISPCHIILTHGLPVLTTSSIFLMPSVKQKSCKYHFYQFMPNGLFYLHSSDRSISTIKHVWFVFVMTMFYRNSYVFNANSVDPDQMPHSLIWVYTVCSCPFLWDARLKWVIFGMTLLEIKPRTSHLQKWMCYRDTMPV